MALVALAASAGLAGCTSFGPYGGSGVSVGLGSGSPYGYGYGSPYGYGYGYGGPYGYMSPYFGWYDGFYYPGAGYYVYDPYGYPHYWTSKQQSHWADILENARNKAGAASTAKVTENWSGFSAKAATPTTAEQQRSLNTIRERIRANQVELQAQQRANVSARASADRASIERIREARSQARIERQQAQGEQREIRMQDIMERRATHRARKSGDD
jgi:hypothetical protein